MSDEMIIEYCSPTLAGIKTANLFNCRYDDWSALVDDLKRLNRILNGKGIRIIPVKCTEKSALIYMYRPERLQKDLCEKEAQSLLRSFGYDINDVSSCLRCLSKRLRSFEVFPHEIGLFLGYPVEDVKGFIKHKGECSKCVGCWKVYGDVDKAEDTFERFKKCTRDYKARFRKGASLDKLIV